MSLFEGDDMIITFDIETIPVADPKFIEEITASVKPPRTLKKAESINAWWKDEGEQAKLDAIAKTSLDGTYGRICCIGWKIDDAPAVSVSGDEVYVIEQFFAAANEAAKVEHYGQPITTHTVIGHNITGFDLRFIWQRAVIHGIQRPSCIPWKAKAWDGAIQDTMTMWNPDREKRISLDRLCKILGFDTPKGDLDGSKIAQAWADGRAAEIETYCRADVEATYLCWLAMTDSPINLQLRKAA